MRQQYGRVRDAMRQAGSPGGAVGDSCGLQKHFKRVESRPITSVKMAISSDEIDFNVTRCRYAEFYRGLGLAELGYLIHCNRDHAMIDGFNPDLALTRTQTVMEGASHCDFRFRKKRDVSPQG
jgi:L-2-amino-thiazoline-4-carboxylic acid hydrolase